jgi:two-component system cell cycle response regulator DivK
MTTVFIVEDNYLNFKMLNDVLEAYGYVCLHSDGDDDVVKRIADTQPDLIIMDVQLPRVTGIELTKSLKEYDQTKAIPILIVTAFALKGDEEMLNNSGCSEWITKPISIHNLVTSVKRLTNS